MRPASQRSPGRSSISNARRLPRNEKCPSSSSSRCVSVCQCLEHTLQPIDDIRVKYKFGKCLHYSSCCQIFIAERRNSQNEADIADDDSDQSSKSLSNIREPYAIKVIDRSKLIQHNKMQETNSQINFLQRGLHHENIVQVHELLHDSENYYLVLEYIEFGNLYE